MLGFGTLGNICSPLVCCHQTKKMPRSAGCGLERRPDVLAPHDVADLGESKLVEDQLSSLKGT